MFKIFLEIDVAQVFLKKTFFTLYLGTRGKFTQQYNQANLFLFIGIKFSFPMKRTPKNSSKGLKLLFIANQKNV